jgi:hypothetical protein
MTVRIDGRVTSESPELQRVLRELAQAVNVLAGRVFVGEGSPESVVVADKGSVYLRTDGGAGTVLWVKESGAGLATGWVSK